MSNTFRNAIRAMRAIRALHAHASEGERQPPAPEICMDESNAVDLVTDLFHAFGVERMREIIHTAEGHHQYETEVEGTESE